MHSILLENLLTGLRVECLQHGHVLPSQVPYGSEARVGDHGKPVEGGGGILVGLPPEKSPRAHPLPEIQWVGDGKDGWFLHLVCLFLSLCALCDAIHVWQEHKGARAQFDPVRLSLCGKHFVDPLLARSAGLSRDKRLHALASMGVGAFCDQSALIVIVCVSHVVTGLLCDG